MCPGLISAGANIEEDLETETAVAIKAEGKEVEIAVGLLKMSTKDM